MTTDEAQDERETAIGVAVVTVSGSLSLAEDRAGTAVEQAVENGGHEVVIRERINDGHDNVQSRVSRLIDRDDVGLIVTVGGVGVSPDDVTPEAVRPLLGAELPAFADLFNRRCDDALGTRILPYRTFAGIGEGVPVFCLPLEEDAARIGCEDIVVPEAGRLVAEAAPADEAEE